MGYFRGTPGFLLEFRIMQEIIGKDYEKVVVSLSIKSANGDIPAMLCKKPMVVCSRKHR